MACTRSASENTSSRDELRNNGSRMFTECLHRWNSSYAFQDDGDALAHTDAHCTQGILPLGALQLVDGGSYEPRATRSEGMTDCNGPTVRIDVRRVVGKPQFAEHRQTLRGKSLVEFDYAHLADREFRFGQHFPRCRYWTHSHDARRNTRGSSGDDSCLGSQTKFLGGIFRSNQ